MKPTTVDRGKYEGPMTRDQVQAMDAMREYIDFCLNNGISFQSAIRALLHDLSGHLGREQGISSKARQYASGLAEMADDTEIQKELRQIEAEFAGTESDGLEVPR